MHINELKICRLNIQLTKSCNQRCRMCNSYKLDNKNEMKKNEVFKVIEQVCNMYDIKNIACTGGEPTLRKDILEIIKYAKLFSQRVSLTTNGSYIKSEKDLDALIDNGINNFTFSYHGIGTHSEFTGIKDSEHNIRQALDMVSKVSAKKQVEVKIGMLLTNQTINQMDQMLEYCKEKGFKLFIELPDHVLPIFKNDIYSSFELFEVQIEKIKRYLKEYSNYAGILLMDEKVKTYLERYLNKDPIKGSCPLGYTDIYIGSEGNVYSGCWVLPSIGNIREQDINQIMKGEKYHNNIEHMIQKKCPTCTCSYMFQAQFMD